MSQPQNPYESPKGQSLPGSLPQRNPVDSEMQTSDWLLAILCSGIGCIMGIVYLIQGKPKAGKMIGISLMFVVIWNIVNVGVQLALQGGR